MHLDIPSFYLFLAILCPTFAIVFGVATRKMSNNRRPWTEKYYSDKK